ncbi:MAG: hydrogenase maturation protease [Candidatus Hodarchaeota archaeon]
MVSIQELQSFIESAKNGKLAIFCVGNDLRGDDGIGPVMYNRLKGQFGSHILIYNVGQSIENFFSVLSKEHVTHCLIIDAVQFGANGVPPGTVGFYSSTDLENKQVTFSTHLIPMKVFLDYMKNKSGVKIRILGVQPKTLEFGSKMSSDVLDALDEIENFLIPLLQVL